MNLRSYLGALLIALFALAVAAPVQAHHSFSGVFDAKKQVALKGVITKIDWINPHVHIYVDVKGDDGKVTSWAIETLPTNHLRKAGIAREDFWNDASKGEVVTVYGQGARDDSKHAAWLERITYADGHFFHLSGDPKEIDVK